MRTTWIIVVAAVACRGAEASPHEPLVGGPCDICEDVFDGKPNKLSSSARIGTARERGEPLVIEGVVRKANKPVAGVIVYAYQTNAEGKYPPGTTRHGSLRGWALTAKDGSYRFATIRPASYPNSKLPQHVHMQIVEPGKCHYYIDDVVFTDDPLLTPQLRKSHTRGRGGIGIATPARGKDNTWRVRRDITLGAGVPDYDRCRSSQL